jgi:NADPH:quinone reductase-like Zn-dependent oxidoreductase
MPSETHIVEDWRKALTAMTDGKPMDVIFDAVGGDISPIAFRTLGWRGRHLVVGFAAGTIPALPMNIALLKGALLVSVDSAQIRKREPEVYHNGTRTHLSLNKDAPISRAEAAGRIICHPILGGLHHQYGRI